MCRKQHEELLNNLVGPCSPTSGARRSPHEGALAAMAAEKLRLQQEALNAEDILSSTSLEIALARDELVARDEECRQLSSQLANRDEENVELKVQLASRGSVMQGDDEALRALRGELETCSTALRMQSAAGREMQHTIDRLQQELVLKPQHNPTDDLEKQLAIEQEVVKDQAELHVELLNSLDNERKQFKVAHQKVSLLEAEVDKLKVTLSEREAQVVDQAENLERSRNTTQRLNEGTLKELFPSVTPSGAADVGKQLVNEVQRERQTAAQAVKQVQQESEAAVQAQQQEVTAKLEAEDVTSKRQLKELQQALDAVEQRETKAAAQATGAAERTEQEFAAKMDKQKGISGRRQAELQQRIDEVVEQNEMSEQRIAELTSKLSASVAEHSKHHGVESSHKQTLEMSSSLLRAAEMRNQQLIMQVQQLSTQQALCASLQHQLDDSNAALEQMDTRARKEMDKASKLSTQKVHKLTQAAAEANSTKQQLLVDHKQATKQLRVSLEQANTKEQQLQARIKELEGGAHLVLNPQAQYVLDDIDEGKAAGRGLHRLRRKSMSQILQQGVQRAEEQKRTGGVLTLVPQSGGLSVEELQTKNLLLTSEMKDVMNLLAERDSTRDQLKSDLEKSRSELNEINRKASADKQAQFDLESLLEHSEEKYQEQLAKTRQSQAMLFASKDSFAKLNDELDQALEREEQLCNKEEGWDIHVALEAKQQIAEKQKEINAMTQLVMDRDESNKNLRNKVDILTKHIQVHSHRSLLLVQ